MDFKATKNQQEREDSEAGRLVRPNPKDKPPRHDRRRERVKVDRDPDLKSEHNPDSDLSKNYKDIGGSASDRSAARSGLISVRNKETGKVVQVSPEGLKKSPGKYEKIEKGGKPKKEAPSDTSKTESPDKPKSNKGRKKKPGKKDPETSTSGEKAKGKKKPEQKGGVDPKQESVSEKDQKDTGKAEAEESEPSVAEKVGIAEPKRPEPTEAEWIESMDLIQDTFPSDVAANLLGQSIHPDDVREMAIAYKAAQEALPTTKGPKGVQSFTETVGSFYETDPNKVKPPTKGRNAAGEEVDFDKLSPSEQSMAYRQHQMQVVAMSMAAKERLTRALTLPSATGAPRVSQGLAKTLAGIALLGGGGEASKALTAKAFENGISSGESEPLHKKHAAKLLSSLSGPAAQVAKAYLQGQDYNHAKKRFLKGSGEDVISEHQSARDIVKGLGKAGAYFQGRAKDYGDTEHQAGTNFRVKVLSQLRKLDPKKYREVRTLIDKKDSVEFDKKVKAYEKAHSAWERRKSEHEKASGSGKTPYKPELFNEPAPTPPKKPARYVGDTKASGRSLVDSLLSRVKKASGSTQRIIFTYSNGEAMSANVDKSAVYHGIDPADNDVGSYPEWSQPRSSEIGEEQIRAILAEAREWLSKPILAKPLEGYERDTQLRAALDLGVKTSGFARHIPPQLYDKMLARLAGRPEPGIGETLTKLASPHQSPLHEVPSMNSSTFKSTKESAVKTVHKQQIGKVTVTVRKDSHPRHGDRYRAAVLHKGLVLWNAVKFTKKDAIQAADDWMASPDGKKTLDKRASNQTSSCAPSYGMNSVNKMRVFAAKLAESNPKLAYELSELIDNVEQPVSPKIASADERFTKLRSVCIRTASADAGAKKVLMPILQVIKDLG